MPQKIFDLCRTSPVTPNMIACRSSFSPPAPFPASDTFSCALKSRHRMIAEPNSFRITLFRKSACPAPKCSKITPFLSRSFAASLSQLLSNHTVSQNNFLTPPESYCFILTGLKVLQNHTVSKTQGGGGVLQQALAFEEALSRKSQG